MKKYTDQDGFIKVHKRSIIKKRKPKDEVPFKPAIDHPCTLYKKVISAVDWMKSEKKNALDDLYLTISTACQLNAISSLSRVVCYGLGEISLTTSRNQLAALICCLQNIKEIAAPLKSRHNTFCLDIELHCKEDRSDGATTDYDEDIVTSGKDTISKCMLCDPAFSETNIKVLKDYLKFTILRSSHKTIPIEDDDKESRFTKYLRKQYSDFDNGIGCHKISNFAELWPEFSLFESEPNQSLSTQHPTSLSNTFADLTILNDTYGILIYMPHTPHDLLEFILYHNWSADKLSRIVIWGNRPTVYSSHNQRLVTDDKCESIVRKLSAARITPSDTSNAALSLSGSYQTHPATVGENSGREEGGAAVEAGIETSGHADVSRRRVISEADERRASVGRLTHRVLSTDSVCVQLTPRLCSAAHTTADFVEGFNDMCVIYFSREKLFSLPERFWRL